MASIGQEKFDAQEAGRRSITPDFYGKDSDSPIRASDKDAGAMKADAERAAASKAAKGLATAEKDAAQSPLNNAADVKGIGAKEASPVAKAASTVGMKNPAMKMAFKNIKGKGPIAAIMSIILAVGGVLFGSQSVMIDSVREQFTEAKNGLETAAQTRSNVLFRMQLKGENVRSITTKKVFGSTDKFSMSSNQANKLAQEGITMTSVTNAKGKKQNVLLYDDGSGKQRILVADEADIAGIKGVIQNGELDVNGQKIKVDTDVKTHADAYNHDDLYHNKVKKQSRTWAGSVGHWFDRKTADFLDNFALTRKIFGKFIERVRNEDLTDTRARTSDTIAKSGLEEDGGAIIEDSESFDDGKKNAQGQPGEDDYKPAQDDIDVKLDASVVVDDDGSMTYEIPKTDFDDIETNAKNGMDVNKTTTKLSSSKISKQSLDKAALAKEKNAEIQTVLNSRVMKTAGAIASYGCLVFDTIGAAMIIAGAQETVQLLKVGASFLETVDKGRAGDGEGAPRHTLGNALLAEFATVTYKSDGSSDIVRKRNAMQSSGIASQYTGQKINPKDESVQTFNLSSKAGDIVTDFALGADAFKACSLTRILSNVVSAGVVIAGAVAAVATCIGTGFLGCIAALAVEGGKQVAKQVGKVAVRQTIMSYVTPIVTQLVATWFMRDLITDLAGEHYGNALAAGATKYMFSNHRGGGGSLADEATYAAYRIEQEKVIADNARFERENRSPFDPTSKYTFLGSIVNQVITLSTMTSGLNVVSGLSTMVGSSILALVPGASAADEISSELMTDQEMQASCPYLYSIGAVGDAYCNPYVITDTSTTSMHPDDVEDVLIQKGQLELVDDGQGGQRYDVVDGSDLAKYVVFCSNRTSNFGLMDTNIANMISSGSYTGDSGGVGSTVGSVAINATPVAGDIVGIFDDGTKLANQEWISGEACVAGNTLGSDGSNWTESGRYYQRYSEDQRLYTSISPEYDSSVDRYWGAYIKAHPLDNSYEGILARFSGYSKDTVIAVLDFVEYQKELAEYDASDRYIFRNDFDKKQAPTFFEFEEQPTVALQQHDVIYDDVRNRFFAMA